MLKWTNSAQKPATRDYESRVMERVQTPHIKKRLRRRTTICQLNKENIVPLTSTPFAAVATPSPTTNRIPRRATHRDSLNDLPKYASTLPRFAEDYSPSTILPSGQELAMRGLLPDVFVGNHRYFRSPLLEATETKSPAITRKMPKRKLEFECKKQNLSISDSTKMTDHSLDKLIDAILESACKTQKRKKRRKSLNLRRRTLLKTHEEDSKELSLSPSYAAGDDPASDLSFLLVEPTKAAALLTDLPPTPLPHTPAYNYSLPTEMLLRMPTPVTVTPLSIKESSLNTTTKTFHLETPIRTTRKRRLREEQKEEEICHGKSAKKYRSSNANYLEVGLALPSIYV